MPDFPQQIRDYVNRNVRSTAPRVRARFRQSGELRLKPDARWVRFEATQTSAVAETAFDWRARVRMTAFLSLGVVDRYGNGEGSGEVRLLGLKVAKSSGGDISEGSALRYLAELPWVPEAMTENRALEWRELDSRTVEASTSVAGRRVSVELAFDDAGDVTRAWTRSRPRKEHKRVVQRAWGGTYSEYQEFAGLRIPTRAEVTWELPDGPFTWFRGRVVEVDV